MVRHLHRPRPPADRVHQGTRAQPDAAERLRGYRHGRSRKLRLSRSEELEFPGDFREETAATGRASGLLAMAQPPTAIFAANDAMAIGCLAALREAGTPVPGDFALAGFDDIPIAQLHRAAADLGARVDRRARAAAAERVLHGVRPGTTAQTLAHDPSDHSGGARIERIRANSQVTVMSRELRGRRKDDMNRRTTLPGDRGASEFPSGLACSPRCRHSRPDDDRHAARHTFATNGGPCPA